MGLLLLFNENLFVFCSTIQIPTCKTLSCGHKYHHKSTALRFCYYFKHLRAVIVKYLNLYAWIIYNAFLNYSHSIRTMQRYFLLFKTPILVHLFQHDLYVSPTTEFTKMTVTLFIRTWNLLQAYVSPNSLKHVSP